METKWTSELSYLNLFFSQAQGHGWMIDQHSLDKKLYERHNAPKDIQLCIQFSDWTMHAPPKMEEGNESECICCIINEPYIKQNII